MPAESAVPPDSNGSAGQTYWIFPTAIGACAVVWRGDRVIGCLLPERDAAATEGQVRRRYPRAGPAEPAGPARAVVEQIVALLAGHPQDLTGIELDLSGHADFEQQVWRATRAIPPGATVSYGELAARLGAPGAARAVGRALGHNPCPIIVPCHRVLSADGRMHGFSAPGGVHTKRRMLEIEGALPPPLPVLL